MARPVLEAQPSPILSEIAPSYEAGAHDENNLDRWRAPKAQILGRGWIHAIWAISRRLGSGDLHLLFGRFLISRWIYSLYRRAGEALSFETSQLPQLAEKHSVFASLPVEEAAREVRDDGVYLDLALPPDITDALVEFATENRCSRYGFDDSPDEHFRIGEVENGYLPDGRMVAWAQVVSVSTSKVVQQIAHDPKLLAMFRACRGYWPKEVVPVLYWIVSLDPSHPANAFLPNAGGLYHYDVGRINHMFCFFYLTDTTKDSGAHAVIKGSHTQKPLSMLFGKRYRSDRDIFEHYAKSRETLIEREAGHGFVEDPKCFHKFYKCPSQNRLTLQLRYS